MFNKCTHVHRKVSHNHCFVSLLRTYIRVMCQCLCPISPVGLITSQCGKDIGRPVGRPFYLCGPAPTSHMLPMFKTHRQDRARHWTLLLITCDEKCKLYRVIRGGEPPSSCVVTFPLETIFVAVASLFIIRLVLFRSVRLIGHQGDLLQVISETYYRWSVRLIIGVRETYRPIIER